VDWALVSDAGRDDLAQPMVEQGRCVLVNPDQICGRAGWCAGNEVLAQPKRLILAEF
jgi:hypothetical protein